MQVYEQKISLDLTEYIFEEVLIQMEAPTYVVSVHPEAYADAYAFLKARHRIAVVAYAFDDPYTWRVEEFVNGVLTKFYENTGA